MENRNLILICGKSKAGKTASLRNIKNQKGVMYLNCESNKPISFASQFQQFTIIDPLQVYEAFEKAETMQDIHTIVVDSLTFLMDMFESVHIVGATNTMQKWGDYAQFFKNLMQQYVSVSTKDIIFIAHTASVLNEDDMVLSRQVPIKGALKGVGVEAFFTLVIAARVLPVSKLVDYESKLLTITEEEKLFGMKHVFQTKLTKETVHDRIGAPIGMFSHKETFTDNDITLILDRVKKYYK